MLYQRGFLGKNSRQFQEILALKNKDSNYFAVRLMNLLEVA